ncbi:MAG: hypothetical protein KDJ52_26445 [Anaerolineae bacterium]|nr:hypothetical protein [Anaerolineae bacterium]
MNFEKEYGRITELYICGDSRTAAVLTEKHRFLTEYHLGNDPDLERLLIKIDCLAAEANRLLSGRDLEECTRLIYSVAHKTLTLVDTVTPANQEQNDNRNGSNGQPATLRYSVDRAKLETLLDCEQQKKKNETIASIKQLIQNAKAYHHRAARLRAQLAYFYGTALGIALLITFILLLIVFLPTSWFADETMMSIRLDILLSILFSGGIGAIVSVMSRISSSQLVLDYEADKRTLHLIGVIRPLIGAVFAVIIIMLLKSALVANFVQINPGPDNLTLLVLGFLAGFSERFAPDLLDTAQRGLNNQVIERI